MSLVQTHTVTLFLKGASVSWGKEGIIKGGTNQYLLCVDNNSPAKLNMEYNYRGTHEQLKLKK